MLTLQQLIPELLDNTTAHTYYVMGVPPGPLACELEPADFAHGTPAVWLSGREVASPLHRDETTNTMIQILGSKTVRLWPPQVTQHMNPVTDGSDTGLDWLSPIDPLEHERFPNFAAAIPSMRVVELGAGDVLTIPRHWWHHVVADSPSLSITYARDRSDIVTDNP